MKPALLEVMRMNRICRMVLATCLGSFILVIFYFQSMLHPVMRRNPFGVDICCRKGSRSPLQELYNPTQVSPPHFLVVVSVQQSFGGNENLQNSVLWGSDTSLHCLALYCSWLLPWLPFLYMMALKF